MRADKFNGFSGVDAQRVTKAVFQVEYSANQKKLSQDFEFTYSKKTKLPTIAVPTLKPAIHENAESGARLKASPIDS